MKRTVAVNENGKRIGEDHPRAKLTNHEVELMFELKAAGLGYGRIGKIFEVSKATVQHILTGRRRAQCAMGWRTVVCI